MTLSKLGKLFGERSIVGRAPTHPYQDFFAFSGFKVVCIEYDTVIAFLAWYFEGVTEPENWQLGQTNPALGCTLGPPVISTVPSFWPHPNPPANNVHRTFISTGECCNRAGASGACKTGALDLKCGGPS